MKVGVEWVVICREEHDSGASVGYPKERLIGYPETLSGGAYRYMTRAITTCTVMRVQRDHPCNIWVAAMNASRAPEKIQTHREIISPETCPERSIFAPEIDLRFANGG